MSDQAQTFTGWAVLELMGHRKRAGFVSEQPIPGGALLRIDVPATEADPKDEYDLYATTPARTECYGASAVFCLTPCDETVARRTARLIERGNAPRLARALPAGGAVAEDADFVDLDDDEDDDREEDSWRP